ncbi:MAG: NYN domain-containing protein [Gordonibacter sp.]|uniref:NYN domain-containing protein n=2 Tax=Gordonibacter sp. TaxID=1968902 RepID=UPI002FC676CB
MEKQSSEKRFALLIDADNVSAKYIKPITDELSNYGTVTYKRIYGDWTLTLHAKWKDALLENSINPIQQFGYTQGKNATDSAMIIDAMDILYTRSVEGFCIVSSDSDFTRLASRIRESGLTVIGMGEKKTPTPFRKACDIFTTLELLLGDSKAARNKNRPEQGGAATSASTGLTIAELEQAVVNIITDNQNNGKSTGLGEVGSRLLKRYPDFDVRSYGTNLLSKLLDEFASVQITKDGSSVTVELAGDAERERKNARGKESSHSRTGQTSAEAAGAQPVEQVSVPAEAVSSEAVPAVEKDTPATEKSAPAAAVPVVKTGADKKPRRSTRVADKHAAAGEESLKEPASEPVVVAVEPESPGASAVVEAGPSVPEEPVGEVSVDNRPGRAGRKKVVASRATVAKRPAEQRHPRVEATQQSGQQLVEQATVEQVSIASQQPKQPIGQPQPTSQEQPQPTSQEQPQKQSSDITAQAKKAPAKRKPRSAKPVASKGQPVVAPKDESAPAPEAKPVSGAQLAPAAKHAPAAKRAGTAADPQAFIRQAAKDAGPEGAELAALGKRVRAKFRTFKLRDLGYSQFRPYVADLEGVTVQERDGRFYACAGK